MWKLLKNNLEKLRYRFPNLSHYIDDWDIREKDEGYRKNQNDYLKKFLGQVIRGKYLEAEKISFL